MWLHALELGCRCAERGLREGEEPIVPSELLGRNAEDAFGNGEVVGEVEVLDVARYRASLSRMAWFSLINRASRS
jgi:hypothetical protein